jgi:cytochrome b6-f complex iron-sulfur subunit
MPRTPNTPPATMNRRRFLQVIEHGGVAALCARVGSASVAASLVAACGGLRFAPSSLQGSLLMVAQADITATGVLVDAPEGALPIFVRAVESNRFRALSTRCMHRGCQVEPAADRFVCPCHGSEYAADGTVLTGPTELPLVEYRVSVADTRITIHLDEPVTRGTPS